MSNPPPRIPGSGPSRPPPKLAGQVASGSGSGSALGGIGSSFRPSVAPSSSGGAPGGQPAGDVKPKTIFKPKMPVRRAIVKTEGDTKPGASAMASALRGRGAPRARGQFAPRGGRGGGRGGAMMTASDRGDEMVASGPFALGPSAQYSRSNKANANAFAAFDHEQATALNLQRERKPVYTAQGELYSDEETQGGRVQIIDMELVPEEMGESAPTGLIRDRSIKDAHTKSKSNKKKQQKKEEERQRQNLLLRPKQEPDLQQVDLGGFVVKAEPMDDDDFNALPPISPSRKRVEPSRDDDVDLMGSEDEDVDMDENGVRIDTKGKGKEGEKTAQAVDLSESEPEEEEEDMTGDFVAEEGMDKPEDKLYLFQFPNPFPHFIPSPSLSLLNQIDLNKSPVGESSSTLPTTSDPSKPSGILKKSVKFGPEDDVKPSSGSGGADAKKAIEGRIKLESELRKAEAERKPEGRIGTLVVMKSGKVKMVLGDGIVMDVTAGVPTTYVQQIVHLDKPSKSAAVLGEVHKTYVMTPDIDRLLGELQMTGGKVPGEDLVIKEELVKMEQI